MPTLAICRGFQLLNVARGGDLVQHLPETVGHEEHKQVPGAFVGASRRGQGRHEARARSWARADGHARTTTRASDASARGSSRLRGRGTGRSRASRIRRGGSRSACSGIRRRGRTARYSRARRRGARVPRAPRTVGLAAIEREERVYYFGALDHLRRAVGRVHRGRLAQPGADAESGRRSGSSRCCSCPSSRGSCYGIWRLRQSRGL